MIKKLLIANRGEIACRIIKTAKKLNIQTVAIYSEIDRYALHVQLADESFCVGLAASATSYLNVEKIIRIAQEAQAEAIHPGYGFLSEDAEFAEQCEKAHLIFVGPSAQAIRMMGDKTLAKTTMIAAGVPVIPGYHGETTDFAALKIVAEKMGFPLLVKASAGGGGKGMRLINHLNQLTEAVQGAMREAQASFGDSRVFLEKYLAQARHIEVQILFDQHGHGISLFDRDCSTQRRHQKVVEEAPAPHLTLSTRQKMANTALRAGAAIHYSSTGTIEFLVDENEDFYFMEMNTRLQVEHAVTEMITGLDLIEWQLRIANGEPLTHSQAEIKAHGHAIEARLYAENPQNNFMPSAGVLRHFHLPTEKLPTIRIDSGFITGDQVSIYYDPLLAKLVAWGETRQAAIHTLQAMLNETAVLGIHTNWSLLNRILNHASFIEEKITTNFIPEHQSELLSPPEKMPSAVIAIGCLSVLAEQQRERLKFQPLNADIFSPWRSQDNWRITEPTLPMISFWQSEKNWRVSVKKTENVYQLQWDGQTVDVIPHWHDENKLTLHIHDQKISAIVFMDGLKINIFSVGELWSFDLLNPLTPTDARRASYELSAPMPGTLVEIYVKPGQIVAAGERLLIMEAMKMEHALLAPRAGKIQTICHNPGDRINEGAQLIIFANESTP